ncbi:2-oxo-4-hydroxy-4-carboxy-5-ureidoimidazoline decarboxylase [Haloechinothrix salitolerans]|uniref:2-oxo-4-hydroxy-4-carboxy-5-ureidoimidazoline decarboxylase n=1 Tax=Haloechinothrix salitolerans TaxID=926830 RepID=A0ABW2C3G2_9PSEU
MAQLTSDRDDPSLTWLNNADPETARDAVVRCCSAPAWVDVVTANRPYRSLDDLLNTSDDAVCGLTDHDIEQAIAGHPRIGDTSGERWSRQEQSGTHSASDDVRAELAKGNAAYEERFGRVFLICATGLSAEEMLAQLRERIGNDPETERAVVREELRKINRLRLEKLVRS